MFPIFFVPEEYFFAGVPARTGVTCLPSPLRSWLDVWGEGNQSFCLLPDAETISLAPVQPATPYRIVLVTAPDLAVARELAQAALERHLVACANLLPGAESHYWWEGRLAQGGEVLILFKTTGDKLAELEALMVAKHPYDTPEFVVLEVAGGNARYLAWLGSSVAG